MKHVRINNEVIVLADGTKYTHDEIVTLVATTNVGGITGDRPVTPVLYQSFFDTTLGYSIDFDGTNWVDATGLTV